MDKDTKNAVIDLLVHEAMRSVFFPHDLEGALIVSEYRIRRRTGSFLHEQLGSWAQYHSVKKEATERLKKRSR